MHGYAQRGLQDVRRIGGGLAAHCGKPADRQQGDIGTQAVHFRYQVGVSRVVQTDAVRIDQVPQPAGGLRVEPAFQVVRGNAGDPAIPDLAQFSGRKCRLSLVRPSARPNFDGSGLLETTDCLPIVVIRMRMSDQDEVSRTGSGGTRNGSMYITIPPSVRSWNADWPNQRRWARAQDFSASEDLSTMSLPVDIDSMSLPGVKCIALA